jgi:hypothetical protein
MTDVHAEVGFTRNLGNYETLRISVGVTDSLRGDEKVSDAFERVYAFVSDKLIEKVNETERDIKESTPTKKPRKKG